MGFASVFVGGIMNFWSNCDNVLVSAVPEIKYSTSGILSYILHDTECKDFGKCDLEAL